MIGYKVVGKGVKSFRPATENALQSVRYRIGQWTSPENSGPCAVFDTLEYALDFLSDYGEHILVVAYTPSSQRRLWKHSRPKFVRNSDRRVYHAESNGIESKEDFFPKGTCFADDVLPLCLVGGSYSR